MRRRVALIDPMNPQWGNLSEERRRAGKEPGFSARHAENDSLKKTVG